jgi:hypothetical protein
MSELTLTEFSRKISRDPGFVYKMSAFLKLPAPISHAGPGSGRGQKKYYRESDLAEWYQKAREIKSAK